MSTTRHRITPKDIMGDLALPPEDAPRTSPPDRKARVQQASDQPCLLVSDLGETWCWDGRVGEWRHNPHEKPYGKHVGVWVLETFIGPRPHSAALCCHRNDERGDNWVENLYWGTRADNIRDRHEAARRRVREAARPEVVQGVLLMYLSGQKMSSIAREYGTQQWVIREILVRGGIPR